MSRTRLSLFYLATYLTIGGIGFLAVPQTMLVLFFSNGDYSNMMQLVGEPPIRCGHFASLDAPDALAAAVLDFAG